MREETSHLLATLNALDTDLVDVMLGLLTDELSPDEQRRFAQQFTAAGKLLEEHAELTTVADDVELSGDKPVAGRPT